MDTATVRAIRLSRGLDNNRTRVNLRPYLPLHTQIKVKVKAPLLRI